MIKPKVAIMMGSDSDLKVMNEAAAVLQGFGVGYEIRILSAHRTPKQTVKYVAAAGSKGIKVIIAGAGGAAHLAGVVAAHTILPVIGVPMETEYLKGMDSLFSTVQMPSGIPVGCMAIGSAGAKNAGLFAVGMLALSDKKLAVRLKDYRERLAKTVLNKNKKKK